MLSAFVCDTWWANKGKIGNDYEFFLAWCFLIASEVFNFSFPGYVMVPI